MIDKTIDFTDCQRVHRQYGGSDRKYGVLYNNDVYMIKFPEKHAKRHDISTSYVNNVISEYISSHIAETIGLPVHQTVLGTYKDEIVVGCKDFRKSRFDQSIEFREYLQALYDSNELGRIVLLDQIYNAIKDEKNAIPEDIQQKSIERYWDTFVVDALVGNFDRHPGNWGYLLVDDDLLLAPTYDYGSTLLPQLADEGMVQIRDNEYEMAERCLVFPSPSLCITKEKVGKIGYYDMMSSNYDENCTAAVLRMAPKIDMEKIRIVIDQTPFISDIRRKFYKQLIGLRKELVIDRAYLRCLYQDYDKDAYDRMVSGKQYDQQTLKTFLREKKKVTEQFDKNEELLNYSKSGEYAEAITFKHMKPIDTKAIIEEQRKLSQAYGFQSRFVKEAAKQIALKKNRSDIVCNRD